MYIDYNTMSVCEKHRTKLINRLGYALVFLFPIFYLSCIVSSNARNSVQSVFPKKFRKTSTFKSRLCRTRTTNFRVWRSVGNPIQFHQTLQTASKSTNIYGCILY